MQLLEILGIPFLICLEMIAILGYLGIHVLKREVIFIDIALAQIAAVGAIGAELAFEAHGHSVLGYVPTVGYDEGMEQVARYVAQRDNDDLSDHVIHFGLTFNGEKKARPHKPQVRDRFR